MKIMLILIRTFLKRSRRSKKQSRSTKPNLPRRNILIKTMSSKASRKRREVNEQPIEVVEAAMQAEVEEVALLESIIAMKVMKKAIVMKNAEKERAVTLARREVKDLIKSSRVISLRVTRSHIKLTKKRRKLQPRENRRFL